MRWNQYQIQVLNATVIGNGEMTNIMDAITLINNNYQDLNRRFRKSVCALENAYANIN